MITIFALLFVASSIMLLFHSLLPTTVVDFLPPWSWMTIWLATAVIVICHRFRPSRNTVPIITHL